MAIGRRTCYCNEKETEVEAVVDEQKKGRGKNAEIRHSFLRCSNSSNCDKSTFCRFVNPLTTRNPLELATTEVAS